MAITFVASSTQYLSRPVALLSAFPISLVCWWKPTNLSTTQVLMSIAQTSGGGSNSNTISIYTDATHLNAQTSLAGPAVKATSTNTPTAGTWHHCVGVFASSISRTVYLDNVAVTNTASQNLGSMNITGLGAYWGGAAASYPANGTMAYAAIYSAALSAADVSALYNGGAGADPRRVTSQNSALQSFTRFLEPSSPWTDEMTGVQWTTGGTPTTAADPFPIIDRAIIHAVT